MSINVSEIDPNRILNMSEYDYIGLSYIPMNDIIYLYPNTIITTIGSILNIFCVIIYFKKEFNLPMFFYFKVLSICNLIQNLTGIPYCICSSYRIIIEEMERTCATYVTAFIAFGSLLTYYESVLEIAILLDRLKTFNKTVKKYLKLTPQKFSLILFVICLLINIFYMLVYTPEEFVWYNYKADGTLEKKNVWLPLPSNFASSNIGRIFTIITYIVREFFTIIFTLGLSLFLLNYMRTYFKNKSKMSKMPVLTAPNQINNVQSDSIQQKSFKNMNKAEEKFILSIILQCSLTILTRSTFFTCCVMALFNNEAFTQIWCAIADFNILFTSAVSFFIYFFFNKLFKIEFLRLFNIQ